MPNNPESGIPATSQSDRRTVLFVDDDEAVRMTVGFALQHLGYEVLQAAGAAEALKLMVGHPSLDLMITDIRMGEMSGLDLAQMAREHHPRMRVMFCTGATPEWLAEQGVEVDTSLYILKPVSLADLKAKLELAFAGAHD